MALLAVEGLAQHPQHVSGLAGHLARPVGHFGQIKGALGLTANIQNHLVPTDLDDLAIHRCMVIQRPMIVFLHQAGKLIDAFGLGLFVLIHVCSP